MYITDAEIEKLLRKLPRFKRDRAAEALFFKKLEAAKPSQQISFFSWPRLAFAMSSLIILLFLGGTLWIYQPSVTRGHALYPWKQTAEKVELAFASSPLDTIEAHLRFSDRRLDEADYILQKSPSLAWLIQKATAHSDEIHLDSDAAVHFADTLEDMRIEKTLASEILEQNITEVTLADLALEKIETRSDMHVQRLKFLEEASPAKVKQVVKIIREEENEDLAAIIEAHEEVREKLSRKEHTIKIRLMKRKEKVEETSKALQKMDQVFKTLPPDEKIKLEKKLERAKEALKEGKSGRAQGLLRAVQNQVTRTKKNKDSTLHKPEKIEKRKEIEENEGEKNRESKAQEKKRNGREDLRP